LQRTALALHRIWWTMRRLGETELGLEPLPPSELEVLGYVGERSGSSVTHVALALGMQPSNVSAAVRELLRRELIERRSDVHDRRVARLYLTPRAAETRRRIERVWAQKLASAVERMPVGDAAALRAAEPALEFLASTFLPADRFM
jgi:DNA-binding MarR family transcriptional regulator